MAGTTIPTRTRGQRGLLRIRFEPRGERTIVSERYSSTPFGSVRANHPDDTGIPEVQITNPSGGILGGDVLEVDISVAPKASATVLTQAANKVYRGDFAEQRAMLVLGRGAFLEYLPHHLIPYADSDYLQETDFLLSPDATLIAWDACSAGRVARGERFRFRRLRSTIRLSFDALPEVVDRFDLSGGGEHFAGYPYMGVAYVASAKDLRVLADELHENLAALPRILASASALRDGLCGVRVLAGDAAALYAALNRTRASARAYLGLPPPAREVG
ncbi:urease accessory protein UreD [Rubrobacter naiadicus]|uniref:urease accessory protein UreD n=1 Tax=Rubrobacter naiadicus TaxID=1392641 RepID=UPI002361A968|nr:urease accessory protein UreD [Rubrobacter naiadicus]